MELKHKPLTDLPWSAMFGLRNGTVHGVGINGEHTTKNRLTAKPIERADAAYIAHAANAYPKLVEALREYANHRRYGAEMFVARDVLRAIGEEE